MSDVARELPSGCGIAAGGRLGRLGDERGQVLALVVLMTLVIGAAGLAIDVGSWYLKQRQTQLAADSAALAAAQALPGSPTNATSLALSYAGDNGGGLSASDVSFSSQFVSDDTVAVAVTRSAPSFFGAVFGIGAATVHAHAAARSEVPGQAMGVAPIVVRITNPELSGPGCPCFGTATTIPLGKTGAPGAFAMINLDQSKNGAVGASTLGGWIANGFSSYLPLGGYYSDPGAKFNSAPVEDALSSRLGTVLLFPVYDTLTGNGANASYHIIAWAAFHLDSFTAQGNSGALSGYFTQVIWNGIQSSSNPNTPDLGVHSIVLVS